MATKRRKPLSLLMLACAVPALADEIRFKPESDLGAGYLMTVVFWLVVVLALAAALLYLLKRYRAFTRLGFVARDRLRVETAIHPGTGLRLHRVRFDGREYLLAEKAGRLLQLDFRRGRSVDESAGE